MRQGAESLGMVCRCVKQPNIRWGQVSGFRAAVRYCRPADNRGCTAGLHLVFAQLLRIESSEPLLKTVTVGALGVEVDGLRAVDDVLLHQDRRSCPKRQRNRIARS